MQPHLETLITGVRSAALSLRTLLLDGRRASRYGVIGAGRRAPNLVAASDHAGIEVEPAANDGVAPVSHDSRAPLMRAVTALQQALLLRGQALWVDGQHIRYLQAGDAVECFGLAYLVQRSGLYVRSAPPAGRAELVGSEVRDQRGVWTLACAAGSSYSWIEERLIGLEDDILMSLTMYVRFNAHPVVAMPWALSTTRPAVKVEGVLLSA